MHPRLVVHCCKLCKDRILSHTFGCCVRSKGSAVSDADEDHRHHSQQGQYSTDLRVPAIFGQPRSSAPRRLGWTVQNRASAARPPHHCITPLLAYAHRQRRLTPGMCALLIRGRV